MFLGFNHVYGTVVQVLGTPHKVRVQLPSAFLLELQKTKYKKMENTPGLAQNKTF